MTSPSLQLPNLDNSDFYHPVHNRKSSSGGTKQPKPVVLSMQRASFQFQGPGPASGEDATANATQFLLEDLSFKVVSPRRHSLYFTD